MIARADYRATHANWNDLMATSTRGASAIVGVGTTPGWNSPGFSALDQLGIAVQAAAADAGIGVDQIDGLFTSTLTHFMPALSVAEYLGIHPTYMDGTNIGGSSFLAHLLSATLALQAGLCKVACICYGSNQLSAGGKLTTLTEPAPWEAMYSPRNPISGYALATARHPVNAITADTIMSTTTSTPVVTNHLFVAEHQLHKLSLAAKARSVNRAAVIGAGTMGGGIAMCFANAGIPVVLLEKDAERLSQGMARIEENYANSARRGRLSAGDVAQRLACIQGSTRFEDLADVDLVIEAVFEEIGLKHEIFKTLDRVCKPGAILASNTSFLDIDTIASATRRPQDVVGMHFFSPANVMQLLENVRGSATSDDVCATVMDVGRRLGKVAVLVRSCDGFVGNRMLAKRTRESHFLLQEGASPFQIDRVLRDFGLPMGPFAMADLAGLDVGWRNRQSRLPNLTPRERECDMLDRMVAAGRLGQKTQGGFYDYDNDRKATPSPAAEALVAAHRAASGRQARQISDQEILERCLYSMINEAAYILEENIVERASDIDVVWLKGYGFPAYRGGPLCYADQVGLPAILAGLRKYEAEHGSQYWKPANLIVKLAQEGRGFHDGPA